MILNGIDYGRVWCSSGVRGFFGERHPYWFHRLWRPLGLDFTGSTFVAKTTTVEPRTGNMPLGGPAGVTPREWYPRCIRVNFRKAAVLNAVGLSGPGLHALLRDGRWQARLDPFFLSFMAVEANPDHRMDQWVRFLVTLSRQRRRFRAPFGVQFNVSCPNVGPGHCSVDVFDVRQALSLADRYLNGVPIVPKVNALLPVPVACEIASHPHCAAIVCSNTIPWGALPDRIPWAELFGSVSPLAGFGGGGLSGAPLLPITLDWVASARRAGIMCPIVGGGGIMRPWDAMRMFRAGADAVELGSVAIVRPWRVRSIIGAVNRHDLVAERTVRGSKVSLQKG